MKILFASDLHGQPEHWTQLVDLARLHTPDMLIIGGDAFPDGDIDDPVGSQGRFVEEDVRKHLLDLHRLSAKPTLGPDAAGDGTALNVGMILGNHDWACSAGALQKLQRDNLLHVLESDKPWHAGGVAFLGYPCVPPSPYPVKDFERLDYPGQPYLFGDGVIWDDEHDRPVRIEPGRYLAMLPTIQEELEQIAPAAAPDWVLVAHAPPQDGDLDVLPKAGHVGSRSVREFIARRRPALSLHGHIHESPGLTGRFWEQIGPTVAVNPGQRTDQLAAVLVDLSEQAITLTPIHIERAAPEPVVIVRRQTEGRACGSS